ncbi:MAG TPA: hypothetical protein VMO47_05765 [Rhodothermales bacterium]|nr:hypothetical protein [Rhodothermales bacterium]
MRNILSGTAAADRAGLCAFLAYAGRLMAALCLVLSSGVIAAAQQVTTGFTGDASRYSWTAGFDIDRGVGSWHLTGSSLFRSEAFLLGDRVTEWRDENITSFMLLRPLSSRYDAIAFGRASWFSQNSASTQEAYSGIRGRLSPGLTLEPAVGLVIDRKPGLLVAGQTEPDVLLDAGPGLSLRGSLSPTRLGQFIVNGSTDNRWQFIEPRLGRSMLTEASARRDVERGSLTVDVRYANLHRESYQASSFLNRDAAATRADDTIEATTSDTMDAGLIFEYPLWNRWRILAESHFTINNRYVRTLRAPEGGLFFDTNFDRRLLDLNARLAYDTDVTSATLTAARSITEERRRLDNAESLPPAQAAQQTLILRQADFDRGLFTLQGTYSTAVFSWLSFRSSLRGSILRHDTPQSNLDDRDESSYDGDAGLRLKLRQGLSVDLRLFGLEHHTVFLRGTRSGESNTRRSLRFRPGMRWRPSPSTDITLDTEVRAVYTTDDFDLPNQPKNDQSARELKYIAAARRRIAADATLNLEASYSKLLLGRLLWSEFREIPFDTLQTTTGFASIRMGRRIIAETGLRALYRSDFERSLTVRYIVGSGVDQRTEIITRPGRERLLQFGPTTELTFPMTNRSQLRMSGWIQFQQVRFTLYGELPEEDAPAIRRAAAVVERRTIPNLVMTLIWNL